MRIAVLISGGGSNLQALIDKRASGRLAAEIALVLSNRAGAQGLERATLAGIPTAVLSHKDYASREQFDREMVRVIRAHGAESVIMAGFMRIITPEFIRAFPGRILNIHPALLPAFAGVNGQGQAVDWGVRLAGCTAHFVDEEVDHGPVIIQAAVPALPGDDAASLSARILSMEHRILPQATHWLAQGRLELRDRRVLVRDAPAPQADPAGLSLVCPGLEEGF